MRVLVTGGTGYLGRAIVHALTAHGHEPVVFSRSASRSGMDVETFDGDVRRREQVAAAVRGCHAMCHAAALVSVWKPRRAEFDEVNVGGLENVLGVVAEAHLSRLVYTSSFLALPPTGASEPVAFNDYQRTKVVADRVAGNAAAAGAPIVRMYPGVIFGPGLATEGNLVGRSVSDHLAGRLPGVIGADRLWSYAFVDDVADAHVVALEAGAVGRRYFVGGENAPQMRPFEIVRDRLGRLLPRRIPFPIAAAIGLEEQTRAALFRTPPLLTFGTARILVRDWAMDSAVAAHELGYRPRSLAQGMEELLAEMARRNASPHGCP